VDYSKITCSYSQVADYLFCRYRWALGYPRRITRYAPVRPLDFGSATHAGLEAGLLAHAVKASWKEILRRADQGVQSWLKAWVKDRGGNKQVNETERLEIARIAEQGAVLTARTLEWFDLPRWSILKFKGKPAVEVELQVPMPGWKCYRCFIDAIAKDRRDGGTWILNWKTSGSFWDEEADAANLQATAEQAIVSMHGISAAGSCTTMLRSEPPKEPSVNKDGSMSRARIATDWPTYEAALKRHRLKPADYVEEMKPKLDVEFFRMVKTYRGKEEITTAWNSIIVPTAAEMLTQKPKSWPTQQRILTKRGCPGCWARAFCLAELRGEDTDFLLATDYAHKDHPTPRSAVKTMELEEEGT